MARSIAPEFFNSNEKEKRKGQESELDEQMWAVVVCLCFDIFQLQSGNRQCRSACVSSTISIMCKWYYSHWSMFNYILWLGVTNNPLGSHPSDIKRSYLFLLMFTFLLECPPCPLSLIMSSLFSVSANYKETTLWACVRVFLCNFFDECQQHFSCPTDRLIFISF